MSTGSVRFLSLNNVTRIHDDTIKVEGGTPSIRDLGLLASAVDMPQASFSGHHLHDDLAAMAAAYLYHISQNHAFVDGNKRAAAFAAILFLTLNGVPDEMLPDEVEWEGVARQVAEGTMGKWEVTEYLRERGLGDG